MVAKTPPPPNVQALSFQDFFQNVPPGRTALVSDLVTHKQSPHGGLRPYLTQCDLQLHCESELCGGVRAFQPTYSNEVIAEDDASNRYLEFRCRNCRSTRKTYAVRIRLSAKGPGGEVFKYGEEPPFGPPTPARLISLLGDEREYYLKGRRAEDQGMGIGAFAYYRRVIENKKNAIFAEIIRVAEKIGTSHEIVSELKAAMDEPQFLKSVEAIRHGIPVALRVRGNHDPLTLLHSDLSEGVHELTDEECLERATDLRVVLTELVTQLANVLQENAELEQSVSRILRRKTAKSKRGTVANPGASAGSDG